MGKWIGGVVLAAQLLFALQCQGAAPLTWSEGGELRVAALPRQTGGKAGFTLMAAEATGVRFTNELRGDLSLTNAVAHNGSGLAIGDVDGDGWPDLYFCNLQGPNHLYRNLGGWRYEDMPLGSAACEGQLSTGAVFVDVDGDGDLDLLVNGIAAGTRLFLNDGKGAFSEVADSGLSRTASATSMALADIDGDGDLDLYCAHYIDTMHLADPTMRFAMAREEGKWRVTKVNGESASKPYWKDRFEALPDGRIRELPEVHGLYRNDGGGHFTAIQNEPGVFMNAEGKPVPPFRDWGLSVMFRDLNGDGFPDLYVCNDNASPDRVWLNTGKGTFRAADAHMFRHTSRSSMALDFADVDRDGHDDLIVLDMLARSPSRRMMQLMRDYPDPAASERVEEVPRYNRNVLFLGRSDGTFTETAFMAGVAATDWSWCPVFLDVDLDGFEDLLVSNGFSFDVMDQDSHDQLRTAKLTLEQRKRFRQFHPAWPTENIAFRNRGDGTFESMGEAWGFAKPGISYGMAVADLDNDGDLDVVVNNLNEAASLYRNDTTSGRVAVRLQGAPPNTSGIGAHLRLTGGRVTQTQDIICGGRYMSCDQAMRVFAADDAADKPLELEVTWRNGNRTTVRVKANTICEVVQAKTLPSAPATTNAAANRWFTDISEKLGHRHAESEFDDWARQPLLPRRLSRLGPGLAWVDVNGDGWEDLVVSAARGGHLAVLINERGQGFRQVEATAATPGDEGAVVGWPDGQGRLHLLAAWSGYEAEPVQPSAVAILGLTNQPAFSVLPEQTMPLAGGPSPGPLALGDVDGDGDLDAFVGGRFLPGRYPEPVSSSIWLNERGELRPNAAWSAAFAGLGMVSGATCCDLDGDGKPDLALALEWGPLRVFRNAGGRFEDMTEAWGLAQWTGWWTSVTAGDFDGDGKLDLAAGNWGRNTPYELDHPAAIRVFYDDWNGDGTLELIEAWRAGEEWFPLRNRTWLTKAFSDLPQRFPTHQAFGQATVGQLLGTRLAGTPSLEVKSLESAVFLNRGTSFQRLRLPRAAQVSPVFAINVGDFDADGREDLFLGQNFLGGGSDMSREDGGRGLWLRGRGDGTFDPAESGIKVYGEQRGAALADFNHDGRVDLAISQNNAPTRLYLNQTTKRGLRVSLGGPAANPWGVGAQLRLRYPGGGQGPCRTVQAGSGYWSQDGPVQVLGLTGQPESVSVRWPGGRAETVPLKEGEWDLKVPYEHEKAQ